MNPLVSVIINCHNGEEFLEEAIKSIYAQTYENWEIIFFDNNSIDNTSFIAKSFDHKLKYFKSKEFYSLYQARNKALELCKGEVIGFLDSDDIWIKDKLKIQLSLYNKEFPIVYGGYQIIDSNNNKSEIYSLKGPTGYITSELLKRNFISIGSILINSSLIKEYKFNPYYELLGDYELWVRLSLKNKFISANTILEYSRQHENNISKKKVSLMTIERRKFYRNLFKMLNYQKYLKILLLAFKYEIKVLIYFFKNLEIHLNSIYRYLKDRVSS